MCVCRLHNTRLQAELDTTKSRAAAAERKLVEKLEQASTEITLLHHTLRGLTDELHAALNEQVTPLIPTRLCIFSQAECTVYSTFPFASFTSSGSRIAEGQRY